MAVTITNNPAPLIEFYQVAGGNVRVRVRDTNNATIWQADIPAATWTTINTYMTANSQGSYYQQPMKNMGGLAQQDYAA